MAYTLEQEQEANDFAFALLMPEKEYRNQVDINTKSDGTVDTKKIAEYFNTTVSLAAERGYRLGILKKPLE